MSQLRHLSVKRWLKNSSQRISLKSAAYLLFPNQKHLFWLMIWWKTSNPLAIPLCSDKRHWNDSSKRPFLSWIRASMRQPPQRLVPTSWFSRGSFSRRPALSSGRYEMTCRTSKAGPRAWRWTTLLSKFGRRLTSTSWRFFTDDIPL